MEFSMQSQWEPTEEGGSDERKNQSMHEIPGNLEQEHI